MAVTEAAAALTEAHRRNQLALSAQTVRDLQRLWPAFNLAAIDDSWTTLSPLIEVLVQSRRRQSAGLAAGYYRAFRAAEGITGTPTLALVDTIAAGELTANLLFSGPITAKKLLFSGGGNVAARTFDATASTSARLVLNGGRETIHGTIDADPAAKGWARVTDGNPCAFCAMLASRGAVYPSRDAALYTNGGRKYHDRCGCTAEPVFSGTYTLPGRGEEFQTLWREATKGKTGREARLAFRRAYEGR